MSSKYLECIFSKINNKYYYKSKCKHSNKLPIKVLFNHPIMAFINEK